MVSKVPLGEARVTTWRMEVDFLRTVSPCCLTSSGICAMAAETRLLTLMVA
ncbi:hypothetical protein D3C71_1840380 [compost metagenome]